MAQHPKAVRPTVRSRRDTIKSARVTTTDFQPTLSDVPLVTGLTFDYVTVNKQLPVEKPAVFRTMLALTRMTEKYNITPDSVEFNENSEIILHYYDTVRILLGTDTALEEKMTRVAAILPSLSGSFRRNSIWRITRTATAALSSRKMYKRKGKPSKKRNNPEFFMKYEKNS